MKVCPDCGTSTTSDAVTCAECGSLFDDQIGVATDDAEAAPEEAVAAPAPPSGAINVCQSCGAMSPLDARRCARCGSNKLALRLKESASGGARKGRRALSAWDRRPRVGAIDADVPDVTRAFIWMFVAIGGVKMLALAYLSGALLFGRVGPGGLQYFTYVWRYPLAIGMFLDGFLAAAGCLGLYLTRRYGAILLTASFVLDVVLLGWLLFAIYTSRVVIWPGIGPYIFMTFVCAVCGFEAAMKALRGNLR